MTSVHSIWTSHGLHPEMDQNRNFLILSLEVNGYKILPIHPKTVDFKVYFHTMSSISILTNKKNERLFVCIVQIVSVLAGYPSCVRMGHTRSQKSTSGRGVGSGRHICLELKLQIAIVYTSFTFEDSCLDFTFCLRIRRKVLSVVLMISLSSNRKLHICCD